MKKIIISTAFALLMTGCATQTFVVNGDALQDPSREKSQTFFISGIGQEMSMNAAEVCGGVNRIAKVESKLTFLDGFFNVLTFGIYTPRTAEVYCTK